MVAFWLSNPPISLLHSRIHCLINCISTAPMHLSSAYIPTYGATPRSTSVRARREPTKLREPNHTSTPVLILDRSHCRSIEVASSNLPEPHTFVKLHVYVPYFSRECHNRQHFPRDRVRSSPANPRGIPTSIPLVRGDRVRRWSSIPRSVLVSLRGNCYVKHVHLWIFHAHLNGQVEGEDHQIVTLRS